MTQTITCKSCGNQFSGKFCNQCGEKVYTDHDKSLKHFFEEAFHFITHYDNKLLRTCKLVFFKPGFVSKEISEGIRKKYYPPVSLFLIGVVIYLLFPVFRGMNIRFSDHLSQYDAMHIYFPRSWAMSKAIRHKATLDDIGLAFEAKSAKISKLLLFILIPITGAWLKLLFLKRKKFYFDHFTLAAEINTFFLYFIFLLLPLTLYGVDWLAFVWGRWQFPHGDSLYMTVLQVLILMWYFTVALKRFYELSTWSAFRRSFLFLAGHTFIIYILYRIILFCIVMLLI